MSRPPLFDLNALALHQRRALRYRDAPVMQRLIREAVDRIQDRLQGTTQTFERILCLAPPAWGPLRAHLAQGALCRVWADTLAMLPPDPQPTFDLVISLLEGHWIEDLPDYLQLLRRLLRPEGLMCVSLWGEGTLHELRHTLTEAEVTLRGGSASRVSPLRTMTEVLHMAQTLNLSTPMVDKDHITLMYPDLWTLCQHLRWTGNTHSVTDRPASPPPRLGPR